MQKKVCKTLNKFGYAIINNECKKSIWHNSNKFVGQSIIIII